MRTLAITLASLIFTCGAAAQSVQPTQPLAKHAKKIWTNDDIERLRPGWRAEEPAPAQPEEQPAETPEETAGGPEVSGEKRIEEQTQSARTVAPKPPDRRNQAEYWQKQIAPLQEELGQIEDQSNRIQRARATGEGASNAVNLLDNSSRLSPENQIQLLEQRRAELLRKISDLEDEARRANIPPGWVR